MATKYGVSIYIVAGSVTAVKKCPLTCADTFTKNTMTKLGSGNATLNGVDGQDHKERLQSTLDIALAAVLQ